MSMANPFTDDSDRRELWEMLVRRDITSFIVGNWNLASEDFDEDSFFAVHGHARSNPDAWRISHASLADYRDDWLSQSLKLRSELVDLERALYDAITLRDIEIAGDRAVAHKKFDGTARLVDGTSVELRWQTLYQCRRIDGRWRIVGFIGYLPNPFGVADGGGIERPVEPRQVPTGVNQHVTAGPYSPVLAVKPGRFVVTSGQAAIDPSGTVVGSTIEEQTAYTLDNCRAQLAQAGARFEDVFKVNVFLRDLDDWPRFNSVYEATVPEPRPVRTTIGAALLLTLMVEVEMWAVIA